MISADENMNQLSYRIFSLLSWCILETNRRSRHQRGKQKIVTYITQNFSYHRPCLYIQVHGRENTASSNLIEGTSPRISHSVVLACISKNTTERTLPTKGCPIWYAIFVVESFYNRKVRFVNIWVSGKGIIWRSFLTRDVSISIKSMTTKALFFTVHYKVYSNYVFKSVYKLYVGCTE